MKQMDAIGVFIANLHDFLGHNKTAMFLGEQPGNPAECVLCLYRSGKVTKQEVVERLGVTV